MTGYRALPTADELRRQDIRDPFKRLIRAAQIRRANVSDRDYVMKNYHLHQLRDLENIVAESVGVMVPFNNWYVLAFFSILLANYHL